MFAPVPRPHATRLALTINSAFGGANAAVIITRVDARPRHRDRRPLGISGFGVAHGSPAHLETLLDSFESRGLDPSSQALTAAAAAALGNAGIRVHGALRDRAGLMVGQLRGSPTSSASFTRSIDEGGLTRLSPAAFARIVLNAAAGFCSKLLALRGPLSVVSTGVGSGLTAVALAAELLSTRDDVDIMVAGGCDESGVGEDSRATAACVVLSHAESPIAGATRRDIRVAGWAVAGPDQLAEAVDQARTGAGAGDETELLIDADSSGADPATGAMRALAEAIGALQTGRASRALITSQAGRSVTTALLLTA